MRVSEFSTRIQEMMSTALDIHFFFFSILCLTTEPIHQGHEKRKEIRDVSTFTAQHVRAATRSIKCEKQ